MLKSVRGMHDLIPNSRALAQYQFITSKAMRTAQRYNYKHIQTPHVEFAGLFERTLGTTSDVIKKEMFLLQQNDSLDGTDGVTTTTPEQVMCLRPEGTAGVVRSVIQHNLYNAGLFYMGSMYRYERPQKGRLRQFTQFGVEKIGEKKSSKSASTHLQQDIEVLQIAHSFLSSIGVLDQVNLQLNSLGSVAERSKYAQQFISFLREYENEISSESQHRLKQAIQNNETQQVWRILDSKADQDQRIMIDHNAPLLSDYYNAETAERFEALKELLTDLNISFTVNPYLVRGLDYYSHTTFEFKAMIASSSNTPPRSVAVLAGGRYDGLFPMLGCRDEVDAIGWAAGVERLSLLLDQKPDDFVTGEKPLTIGVIGLTGSNIDRNIQRSAMELSQKLRNSSEFATESFTIVGPIFASKVLSGLQKAEKEGCTITIILGSREVENGTCTVKSLSSRDVRFECKVDQLVSNLNNLLEKSEN